MRWTISALVSLLKPSPRAMISSRRAMSAADVCRSSPRTWVLFEAERQHVVVDAGTANFLGEL